MTFQAPHNVTEKGWKTEIFAIGMDSVQYTKQTIHTYILILGKNLTNIAELNQIFNVYLFTVIIRKCQVMQFLKAPKYYD